MQRALSPCPSPDIFAAYYEHSLDPEETERYDAHIAGCSSCRAILAGVARASIDAPVFESQLVAAAAAAPHAVAASAVAAAESDSKRLRFWLIHRCGVGVAMILVFVLYQRSVVSREHAAEIAMAREVPAPASEPPAAQFNQPLPAPTEKALDKTEREMHRIAPPTLAKPAPPRTPIPGAVAGKISPPAQAYHEKRHDRGLGGWRADPRGFRWRYEFVRDESAASRSSAGEAWGTIGGCREQRVGHRRSHLRAPATLDGNESVVASNAASAPSPVATEAAPVPARNEKQLSQQSAGHGALSHALTSKNAAQAAPHAPDHLVVKSPDGTITWTIHTNHVQYTENASPRPCRIFCRPTIRSRRALRRADKSAGWWARRAPWC